MTTRLNMAKKTINVAKILYWANWQLARTDSEADDAYKQGICHMIEEILHETGNYKGFGYHQTEAFTPTKDNYHYFSRYYLVHDKIRSDYNIAKRKSILRAS